uniref:HMA domain-containing protein n=1 Tax=Pinguiococcus pyrenoidosus TaxID=172671 RepID=A0A7R9Y974_9STRA|mmetsp:Transcript_10674/g.40154  ORF Transcript_10674/g.40154 Transcript_10674/m.40154 type:complete len:301 (+) Transcript_10674:17-919(+)
MRRLLVVAALLVVSECALALNVPGKMGGKAPAALRIFGRARQTRASDAEREANAHLLWSRGFARKLAISTAGIGVLAHAAAGNGALGTLEAALHHAIARSEGQRLAIWSVMGLLSSACCAVQILLNAMSIGCAGFNTYLGPWRPFFLACTVNLQVFAWRGHLASTVPGSASVAAWGSVLACSLAFLPELLALATAWRSRRSRRLRRSKVVGVGVGDAAQLFRVEFHLGKSMGCASCVDSVQRALLGQDGVVHVQAAVEAGRAECVLQVSSAAEGSHRARQLSEVLRTAGFANAVETAAPL